MPMKEIKEPTSKTAQEMSEKGMSPAAITTQPSPPKIRLTYKNKECDILTDKIRHLTSKLHRGRLAMSNTSRARFIRMKTMVEETKVKRAARAAPDRFRSPSALRTDHSLFIRTNTPSPEPMSQSAQTEALKMEEDQQAAKQEPFYEVCIKKRKEDN